MTLRYSFRTNRGFDMALEDNSVSASLVTDGDLQELLRLMRGYCDFYQVAPSDQDLLTISRALIDDPAGEGTQFIARDADGEAIGFATVYWSWSTTAGGRIGIMHDLFVTPTARGTGTAQLLIRSCAEATKAHGGVELIWQTALDNARAQRVYDAVGATRSTWHEYALQTQQPL